MKRRYCFSLFFLTLLFLGEGISWAAPKKTVPRFVSLRSGEVNLRTGPGKQHPIDWVLTRKDLPVEITATYNLWYKIRTHEEIVGWVHKRMVRERSTVMVLKPQILRAKDQEESDPVAHIHAHVIGALKKCEGAWCKVLIKGHKGWLKKQTLWGVKKSS